jgi:RNA polymerase primary sigma factor
MPRKKNARRPDDRILSPEDVLTTYFNEAGAFPLLSRKEEIGLAEQYIKYRTNKSNCGSKTREDGKEAREKLINSNLRLVIRIAKDYRELGLDFADLVSEGNGGLVKAVDRYELDHGAKLSTYAAYWIRQAITRSLSNTSRTIRLPVHITQLKGQITKYVENYNTLHEGKSPENCDIAANFEISESKVKKTLSAIASYVSIDKPVGDEGEVETMANFLPDEDNPTPLEVALYSNEVDMLNTFLGKLKPRERLIIQLRYGLCDYERETLEVVGEKFNLTRERIRQIESAAMRKLRRWASLARKRDERKD